MKKLVVVVGIVVTSVFNAFSQKLIIHVFSKTELVSFRTTTIDSVLSNPDFDHGIDTTHTNYVIDFKQKTSTYFVNNIQIDISPVKISKINDDVLVIKILEGGFDYGLVVNTNLKNESVTWFWFDAMATTVKRIDQFRIEKPI
jgi:hypothetical protein